MNINGVWIQTQFGLNSSLYKSFSNMSQETSATNSNQGTVYVYCAYIISSIAKFALNQAFPKIDNKKIDLLIEKVIFIKPYFECRESISQLFKDITARFNSSAVICQEDLFGPFLTEILLSNLREQSGMFFTPAILSKFVIQQSSILNPLKEAQKIIDPTCGSGSILIELIREIINSPLSAMQRISLIKDISGIDENPIALFATIVNLWNIIAQATQNFELCEAIIKNFICDDILHFHELSSNNCFFQRFDLIIGNLPWNVYNNIESTQIKTQIEELGKKFDLFMTWKNRANLEIATVIFEILREKFLNARGNLFLLLPASLLTASQHAKFRRFTGLNNLYAFHISPDFFPIHAIALYGQNSVLSDVNTSSPAAEFVEKPVKSLYFEFNPHLGTYKQLKEQIEYPAFVNTARGKPLVGKYGVKELNPFLLPISKSPYKSKVFRGVDFTPRRLLFIEQLEPSLNQNSAKIVHIKPDLNQYASTQSKTWEFIPFTEAQVEAKELHPIGKSTDLIPFSLLQSHIIFLPLDKIDHHYSITPPNQMPPYAKAHFDLIDSIFQQHRPKTSKNLKLADNLNYGGKLARVEYTSGLKVIYPVGGSYCKAAIVKNANLLIDVTFYYLSPASDDEAFYLLAWLNSSILNSNLSRVCTVGANGSLRVIHLGPWMFPLPLYIGNGPQSKIASLGRAMERRSRELYNFSADPTNLSANLSISLTYAYRKLREDIQYNSLLQSLDAELIRLFKGDG